jgi:hypothetical protein
VRHAVPLDENHVTRYIGPWQRPRHRDATPMAQPDPLLCCRGVDRHRAPTFRRSKSSGREPHFGPQTLQRLVAPLLSVLWNSRSILATNSPPIRGGFWRALIYKGFFW